MKNVLLLLCCLALSTMISAQYVPIPVTGFNHDVIAEGTGSSSLITTTREMDAITPSNFVICSKQFATANSFTPANSYGIPDNGVITAGTRNFQLAPYTGNNALYLYTSESGTLTLNTPGAYSSISILHLSTESGATVNVVFNFSDGTTYTASGQSFLDWFNNTTNVAAQGFGRIKRKDGPFVYGTDYEGAGTNPRIFYKDFTLPCSKTLVSINFKNTSSTVVTGSNRAFVFAIAGIPSTPLVAPIVAPVSVCASGATTTLTVSNPQTGLTYRWYATLTGGSILSNQVSFTPSPIYASTNYYVEAINSSGCVSTPRVQVPITLSSPPAAPTTSDDNICANNTATLTVTNATATNTYKWYTAATGGSSLYGGVSFTTPPLTATTTYYVDATSTGNCISARTPAVAHVLDILATPAVTATTVTSNSVTFSWPAIPGATGYEVSVNGGSFTAPSSGATGTTHIINGLSPQQTVNITVHALGSLVCQQSTGSATATTLTDEIYVPNIFTPNADGKNDILYVYGNIIQSMRMQVFNQWGEKVFESTDKNSGWDGSYKGRQQPVGVYVYAIRITTTSGNVIDKKGSITLIR